MNINLTLFEFEVGAGYAIEGFDAAVKGLMLGESVTVTGTSFGPPSPSSPWSPGLPTKSPGRS